ncbi:MAG: Ldh family oxidoreductase [Lachnospiraceae bacterium]|nr:Ldh family oxidoreductase [Lachnospiraceae bacterium]
MGYRYLDDKKIEEFSKEVFKRYGYSEEDCAQIADVLLTSDRMGIESHGVQRLIMYVNSIKLGRIHKGAVPEIVKETPLSAVIDAHEAFGQPCAVKAMQLAIDKAKKSGIAMVTVRNSNHYGIAGYYAKMAADQGMMGISMTNAEALVVPTFGKQPMMGTNPIAVSMPAAPHPFHLDMATSVVPAGKMEVYAKAGKTLPDGWLVDSKGQTNNDPNEFLKIRAAKSDGGINPLGGFGETHSGHKGYGLSLLVEIMCAVLSGGLTANYVRVDPAVDRVCHFFMAVDYGMFGDKAEIEANLTKYLNELRDSRKAEGSPRIYTHGDKAYENMAAVSQKGIKVNDKTYEEMTGIAKELGIPYEDYLIEK